MANEPNAANVAICRLPITSSVKANSPGMITIARTARSAAALDHTGSHGVDPGRTASDRFSRDIEMAPACAMSGRESMGSRRNY